MSIQVSIRHRTEYHYDRPVSLSPHIVRLRPAPHCRIPIQSYSLKIEPAKYFLNWQQDPFANYVARLVFPERTRKFVVSVEIIADMTVINPFDFFLDEDVEQFPFAYADDLKKELAPYLEPRENGTALKAWVDQIDRRKQRTIDFLVACNQQLQQAISYVIRMEPGVQTCEQTLEKAQGSCRDTAWLLVEIMRHLGFAARFVSGYLVQLKADQTAIDGPSGPEQDFTDLHAWAEVYLPGGGWIGLDPTSGLIAGEGHIPLACAPEPASAAAVTGSTDKCEVEFRYENVVERIHEDPRVTRPYSHEQWDRIMALGDRVDRQLRQGDVRLTMGGEPTFVSIDDMDGAQWNTDALGERKRELASRLLLRLRDCFGKGGLLHHGQGKWYPGEPLPRWALSVYWRRDGQPLWSDARLLAHEASSYAASIEDAQRFIGKLCERMAIDKARIIPAREDAYYYLWKEGTLPDNLDPLENHLADPLERARIRDIFSRGLKAVVGYVLPLGWDDAGRHWRSSAWPFRQDQLFLLPGDSPLGLRLPLASLPWEAPERRAVEPIPDPFAIGDQLPEPNLRPSPFRLGLLPEAQERSQETRLQGSNPTGDDEIVRTAICVEPRNGYLYVFLPPVLKLEQFLNLVHCIEDVAGLLDQPVMLEGYEPPRDHRLNKIQITPDPGVIEVNIHPASSWRELVSNTEILYHEARQCRLGTEKFQLDGRHSGTGGGNHVTIGGPAPADSPLLRRPDLLRSLVTYWQNHPSLSYLFCGNFIGPTSQAPRIDEARDDNLYELEIAFGQMPQGEVATPWLVDRLFRNLLIDITGNTHRAEFCIDKLYSPDSPTGRLGLVEFRNFEMPPHPQMSSVQMLLMRALIAKFWHQPYTNRLVRWGTALHDRYMLPYFVWQDFTEVIRELHQSGYEFELEWFLPFREFRFPRIGGITIDGVELTLHSALEPWHVLGEEVRAQGTARYVDSSVERIQVKLNGLIPERFTATCNGRRLPLRETGISGECIAGVRFKAWQPHSGLHPTISVHSPLVFDIVDLANRRSIGGCTYHVSHPGGRSYETFPVNANEAEGRRVARFELGGHTQGMLHLSLQETIPEFPYTLDLRYEHKENKK